MKNNSLLFIVYPSAQESPQTPSRKTQREPHLGITQRFLKAALKQLITNKGSLIRLRAHFSLQTTEARGSGMNTDAE